MTLTEFLAARYNQIEESADDHVLADLAVKQELLDVYETAGQIPCPAARYNEWRFTWVILNKIILMEAARFASHPDFNEGWRR